MDFSFSAEDEAFRARARTWLAERLDGAGAPFADLCTDVGPTELDPDRRRSWEQELGAGGWIGLGWSEGALTRQVVWAEEYARARGPAPLGIVGEHTVARDAQHQEIAIVGLHESDVFLLSFAQRLYRGIDDIRASCDQVKPLRLDRSPAGDLNCIDERPALPRIVHRRERQH